MVFLLLHSPYGPKARAGLDQRLLLGLPRGCRVQIPRPPSAAFPKSRELDCKWSSQESNWSLSGMWELQAEASLAISQHPSFVTFMKKILFYNKNDNCKYLNSIFYVSGTVG